MFQHTPVRPKDGYRRPWGGPGTSERCTDCPDRSGKTVTPFSTEHRPTVYVQACRRR